MGDWWWQREVFFHRSAASDDVKYRGWYYYESPWMKGVRKDLSLDLRVENYMVPGLGRP